MAFFAQAGKTLINGQVVLVNGNISQTIIAGVLGKWIEIYSVVISTEETAVRTVTITDGTITQTYLVGGGVPNPPTLDQGAVPVRFMKGTTLTASADAVTAGKHISVMIRGLLATT